jgi:hypothetical protein
LTIHPTVQTSSILLSSSQSVPVSPVISSSTLLIQPTLVTHSSSLITPSPLSSVQLATSNLLTSSVVLPSQLTHRSSLAMPLSSSVNQLSFTTSTRFSSPETQVTSVSSSAWSSSQGVPTLSSSSDATRLSISIGFPRR